MENNKGLPTPEELARRAQEQTVPVSLRVKESVYAILNDYAKQYNTTFGALVSELLNAYIRQYNDRISNEIDLNDAIVDNYISKKAVKLTKLNESELIFGMMQDAAVTNYNEEDSAGDEEFPTIGLHDCFDTRIIAAGEKAEFQSTFDSAHKNTYQLFVPAKKWALVSAILHAYAKKFTRLYNCADPKSTFLIDEKTLKEIANIINKNSSSLDMAKKIANKLTDFKSADD